MHDDRYHYLECGLDDVYLLNGFKRFKSPRGTSVAIRDVDKLHRAIGRHLCRHKKKLNGKEIRFLRRGMPMSQASLAHMLDVKEQTIYRWEAGKNSMPRAAEAVLRHLYMEKDKDTNESLRASLKELADIEDELHKTEEMIFKIKRDRQKQKSAGQRTERWALAA